MKNVFSSFVFIFLLILSGCSFEEEAMKDMEPVEKESSTAANALGAAGMAGVNWADARDNFVDGWVIPSGLTASDDYATVQAKADDIISGFQNNMGANTVRLPINPNSVLESWWGAYRGAIDMSLTKGMKVVIACWEANSSRDGRVDNLSSFWSMWDVVVNRYANNSNVYFEVFNEPHGYSSTDLRNLYANWLNRYPQIPKGRIMLGGTGYSEDVKPIGADSRFNGCLLSLHIYAWWGHHTNPSDWETQLRNAYGSYGSRTVLTEFGVPMTTGMNYNGPASGNYEIAFLQGITNGLRNGNLSSIYWPGLRNGDTYTIQQLNGSGTNLSLSTTNTSGLDRIRYGWGLGSGFNSNAYYRLVNRNSGLVLDVNGASTTNGATVIQWSWSGGNNQQWRIEGTGSGYYRLVNRNSGQVLDVSGGSTTDGAQVIQWPWNGGNNQQWRIEEVGSGYYRLINRNSGDALDVNAGSTVNGAQVIQWPWNGGNNQQWQIIML